MKTLFTFFISLFILFSPDIGLSSIPKLSDRTLNTLKNEMRPLSLFEKRPETDAEKAYLSFYSLSFQDINHYFGWYRSGGRKIAAHIFSPPSPKGTIIILHGYFDHSGIVRSLIRLCLDQNFSAVTIDLPGHGLSDGERGAIDDFKEYAESLNDFFDRYKNDLPEPFNLIAHSTGCAAALEYLNLYGENIISKIVFLGPLVRSYLWHPSKAAFFLMKPFIKKIPRKFRKNSGDKNYLRFVKNDPLEIRHIQTKWLKALYSWNKRLILTPRIHVNTLVIQGDLDKTVAWKYNIRFLKKKLTRLRVSIIRNARHQLPNESLAIREKVFDEIRGFLSSD